MPAKPRGFILSRWLNTGARPIATFAPYAAFVASVQWFFQIAANCGLISRDRPSHSVDMAYLFYLPFCMVFTSSDNLHVQTAPLFLRRDQVFLPGKELHDDMRKLDAHFSAQPQEVLDRGVMHFDPPFDGDFLTTRLWKQFLPGWSAREGRSGDVKMSPEEERKLVAEINETISAPEGQPVDTQSADFVTMAHWTPVKMGKWRIISQDVAERSWRHEDEQRKAQRRTADTDSVPPS